MVLVKLWFSVGVRDAKVDADGPRKALLVSHIEFSVFSSKEGALGELACGVDDFQASASA